MLIPTTYMALHDPEIYENPDHFDPERYYTGDAEEKGAKNYLVFGTGPHYCIGQTYAQLNLALFLGKASVLLDWKHHPTPVSDQIKVFATLFPMVSSPTLTPKSWSKLFLTGFRTIARSPSRRGNTIDLCCLECRVHLFINGVQIGECRGI